MRNIGDVTPEMLKNLQEEDDSLKIMRDLAANAVEGTAKSWYTMCDGILCRRYQDETSRPCEVIKQIVIPRKLRSQVISFAHESIMGDHLSVKETLDDILSLFYWPGVYGDVERYYQSCKICQETVNKGKTNGRNEVCQDGILKKGHYKEEDTHVNASVCHIVSAAVVVSNENQTEDTVNDDLPKLNVKVAQRM